MTNSGMTSRSAWLWRRLGEKLRQKSGIYYRRSYAQCGEDMIARSVFDILRVPHPSYADIGAHHPHYLSNTYHFYREGSRGLNVEPDPALYRILEKARPRDVNLNLGIAPEPGTLDLFIMSSRTLSTFSEQEARQYEAQGIRIEGRQRVEVITINRLFEQYMDDKAPDFLTVDVEGLDLEILASLDTGQYRPTLICVETILYSTSGEGAKRTGVDELLASRGYMKYADTYINTLYIDRERWIRR